MSDNVFVKAIEVVDGADLESAVPQHLLRDLRRADDFIRLAVATGAGLIASLPTESPLPEATGIFLGTTTGSLETNFRFLDTLLDDGEGQSSPTLFSHSVHNSAAGYVARLFDIRGPALTVTTGGWPFLAALVEAKAALATGQLQAALVLGVEEDSPLLAEAQSRTAAGGEVVEPPTCRKGAVGWLLIADAVNKESGSLRLSEIDLEERMADPADYLIRAESISSSPENDHRKFLGPAVLAAPVQLSKAVINAQETNIPALDWQLEATFGRAQVSVIF